jgi:hypothetical protein
MHPTIITPILFLFLKGLHGAITDTILVQFFSLKDGTLNMEILQFKSKFPREVLFCRVCYYLTFSIKFIFLMILNGITIWYFIDF